MLMLTTEYEDGIGLYTNKIENNSLIIELFPNPTNGMVYISNSNGKSFEFQVYYLTGKLIQNGNSEYAIDLTTVEIGIYTILITQESRNHLSKIVISK